ncbi:heme/hemin ABC transporter substrate-binding protein [Marinomonas primoryensis]|uniref:heme/hemin ABC transporter substrate-binding protein n=1 Tax=Marinomonas primoryensis TaxID=178399 RepID=UPI0030D7FB7F|tara:strand:+ start:98038 stop:98952 length:915 start_codon:yes stop_codon:yes gene_type:complete
MIMYRLFFLTCIVFLANSVTYAAPSERIAVAGGSITEIIYRLGEQHRIVGVDSTSQFPEDAKKFPLLGYVRNVSVEGVLSLNPDLLLGEDDTGPTKALKQIAAVGVKTIIIKKDNSIPALQEKITQIAELLGVEGKGKSLLDEMQIDIDALSYAKQHLSDSVKRTPPKVLFLLTLKNGAPIAAGNTTSAHTVIEEAGAINALAQYKGWEKLSPESALKLDPDVIIVMNRGQDIFEQVNALPHFKYTTAVKNKAVYTIDGSYLLGFGPRTPQAIVELGTMIHKDFPLPAGYKFRYQHDVASMAEH